MVRQRVCSILVLAAIALIAGLQIPRAQAAGRLTPQDRWFVAFRKVIPGALTALEGHVDLLRSVSKSGGKIKSPAFVAQSVRIRKQLVRVSSGFRSIPAPTAETRSIEQGAAKAFGLYAAAYTDYGRAFRTGSFAWLDKGDADVSAAAKILVVESSKLQNIDVDPSLHDRAPQALELYVHRLAGTVVLRNEVDADVSALFSALLANKQDKSLSLATQALPPAKRLLIATRAIRPPGASGDVKALADAEERWLRLEVSGLTDVVKGLRDGSLSAFESGVQTLQASSTGELDAQQRLLIIGFKYF